MRNFSERSLRWLFAGAGVLCFVVLLAVEVLTETEQLSFADFAVDAVKTLLVIGAAVGVALLAQRMQKHHEERIELINDLKVARAEGQAWRAQVRSHLAGLKAGMDQQFLEWSLTAAEREVGLLILKGFSHKEIAALRSTSEATVRQQAQAIYRKAGLPGKTAFSGYFLEDLFAAEMPVAEPVGD